MSEKEKKLSKSVTIQCKQQKVRAVRFNIDGSYCLICGADKKINLWNPYRNVLLKSYGGHANEALDAAGSCESSHIISASADKSVIYWDVTTGQPLRRYRTHAAAVTCVKFNEESTMAISGSVDNTVMLWDLKSRSIQPVQVLKEAKDTITSIIVTDHEIISGSVDGNIRLYDLRANKLVTDFIGNVLTCVNLTRDGQCFVVSCNDDTLKLVDKSSGELLSDYKGCTLGDFLIENCLNNKDSIIYSGSTLGDIFMFDLLGGKCVDRLTHSEGRVVSSLSHHSSDNSLLSACDDTVVLWCCKTEED